MPGVKNNILDNLAYLTRVNIDRPGIFRYVIFVFNVCTAKNKFRRFPDYVRE